MLSSSTSTYARLGMLTLVCLLGYGCLRVWTPSHLRISPPYRTALQRIRDDAQINRVLGAPVQVRWWVKGTLDAQRAHLKIPLTGQRHQGVLHVGLRKVGLHNSGLEAGTSGWQMDTAALHVDGSTIVLPPEPLTGILAAAEHLLFSDRATEALLLLEDAEPSPARWRLMGQASLKLDALDDAENALLRSASQDPEDPSARRLLGMVYYRKGQYNACVEAFSDTLRLTPKDGYAWYHRAVCHRAVAEHAQAITAAETACALGTDIACTMRQQL